MDQRMLFIASTDCQNFAKQDTSKSDEATWRAGKITQIREALRACGDDNVAPQAFEALATHIGSQGGEGFLGGVSIQAHGDGWR